MEALGALFLIVPGACAAGLTLCRPAGAQDAGAGRWGGLMGVGGALGPGTSVPGSGWWLRDCYVGVVFDCGLTFCRPAGAGGAVAIKCRNRLNHDAPATRVSSFLWGRPGGRNFRSVPSKWNSVGTILGTLLPQLAMSRTGERP